MGKLQEATRLDAELVARAHEEAPLRLRLGQLLEVLGQGGHFELGFSSMSAYALERCARSVRWVEGARCLARRLEDLPQLRAAVVAGRVAWGSAELVARVAQPEDEARWIEEAAAHTICEIRELVSHAARRSVVTSREARREGLDAPEMHEHEHEHEHEMCSITCTVDREEAWLFESTRVLLEHLNVVGTDAQVEALLAEGQGTLISESPRGALGGDRWQWPSADRQPDHGRMGAAASCHKRLQHLFTSGRSGPVASGLAMAAAAGLVSLGGLGARELDAAVRGLSRELARREVRLSELVLRFLRARGWRLLGYTSEAQYARERLGMSRSSMLARRALAARLEGLPLLAAALEAGQLGVEAASQVARVATPRTQGAWVERARHRTTKHLREEVAAALVAVRWSGELDCPPPMDSEMTAFHELERAVVSGRAYQPQAPSERRVRFAVAPVEPVSEQRRAWLVMLASLAEWLEGGVQLSAGPSPSASSLASSGAQARAGRVELRLRVSRETYFFWHALKARAQRCLRAGMSWLRFLCLAMWRAWRHLLGPDVAYGQIYIRDRCRCRSPVCQRRDVTPHHLRLRSAGGSDDDDNVAAVCTWCHLYGVHGGRIRAAGTARSIRWELGPIDDPCVVVEGRQRIAA